MTLLERFRTQPPQKHPDPTVRLAYVSEIPLEDRESIAAMARGDEDPRVRRAAVAKLMDPAALAAIARDDADELVRNTAVSMLQDIALEAFEGIGERESLAAVEAVADAKVLGTIAKEATREAVAVSATMRLIDARALGSVARHAVAEGARRRALDALIERRNQAELLATAMNGEYKDMALAALDFVTDRADLEQVAARGRNKSAAKRARAVIREADEQSAREAAEAVGLARRAASTPLSGPAAPPADAGVNPPTTEGGASESSIAPSIDRTEMEQERADAEARARRAEETARAQAAGDELAKREAERRNARLAEIAEAAAAAVAEADLATARKRFGIARREWTDLASGTTVAAEVATRYGDAEAQLNRREAEAREGDVRARREALARMQHLIGRVEPLAARGDLTLKAADRALRDVRSALAAIPPLPSRQDYEDVAPRLKGVLATLTAKVQELREAEEWQRWANAGVQEELCAKMEALAALDDPEAIAREIRELQRRWREVADVPRAQADQLWRRFKAAHDAVWPRCEAHFAAEAQARADNLVRKTALAERAEALAESTNWIQTADEIKKLQAEWKTIGPVSRGREKAVWDRFRTACDRFFTRRREDLVARKAVWAENYAKKEALCAQAEALAESTDWDHAAAEIRRLQAAWKTIGPVKKTRSEAIWQRFRGACDRFFARYAERHNTARAERAAAREAICTELEALAAAPAESSGDAGPPPTDQQRLAAVRNLRTRWQQEVAARRLDPEHARALDQRFAAALASVVARWPNVFGGTDLDPDANRKRLDSLVRRMEDLANSIGASASPGADAAVSPTTRLAAMLKEALAANTIGGKADDDSRLRAAVEEVRHAQANWARVGPVPDEVRRPLAERFQRACRRVMERAGAKSGAATR